MADGFQSQSPDDRSPADRWRDQLRLLRGERPDVRCWSVRGLIREGLRLHVGSVPEAFELAYSDARGGEYWNAWLAEVRPEQDIANLLGLHLVAEVSNPEGSTAHPSVLRTAVLDTSRVARMSGICSELPLGLVNLGDLADWMLDNPMRAHLVPLSLRAILEPGQLVAKRDAPQMALRLLESGRFPRRHGQVTAVARELLPTFSDLDVDTLRKYIEAEVRKWNEKSSRK